jgi:hypothetical protein
VAVLLTIWIGCARLLEEKNPALAAAIFPAAVDAQIDVAAGSLTNSSGGDLLPVRVRARDALWFAAGDARLHSVLGEVDLRERAEDVAFQHFHNARLLSKTEINALRRSVEREIRARNMKEAVRLLDVLLRRWPDRLGVVASVFPALLTDEAGFEAIESALRGDPPWRVGFFRRMSEEAAVLPLAENLLTELDDGDSSPTAGEINTIVSAYIREKQYSDAYRLFLMTLTESEQELAGYVYNGGFEASSTGKAFDWRVGKQSAAQISIGGTAGMGLPATGATLRFLNKPVKGILLSQYLQLAPGDYTLQVTASASSLEAPKGLRWAIRCVGRNGTVVEIPVEEGEYSNSQRSVNFLVQNENCDLQTLSLESELIAESWRHRYTGLVTFTKVSVESAM